MTFVCCPQEYFEDLVKFMSSGPSHVLVLTKGQADDSIIKDWRDMLGPPAVEDAKELAPERCVAVVLAGLGVLTSTAKKLILCTTEDRGIHFVLKMAC